MAVVLDFLKGLLADYGYVIVFVAGLLEALPLVGLLVPGQAIIILAGAAAASGLLDIRLLILVAIPAGIIGDGLGYHLGRAYGRGFLMTYGPRFKIEEKHLRTTDALFARFGPFALVVARFTFITRAIGPLLAGISRMKPGTFWTYNVIGAILWSVGYGLLGYFFGVSYLALESRLGRILTWSAIAAVGIYLLYRLMRRYAPRFTRGDFYVALTGSLAGAVFGVLAERVGRLGPQNPLDAARPALEAFVAPAAPALTLLAALTSFPVLGTVSLVLLALLAWRRHVWDAVLVGLGVGGVILLAEGLQPVFASFQPEGYVLPSGFPSSHSAIPLVFAGVVAYLLAERAQRWPVTFGLVAGATAFVAFSSLGGLATRTEQPSSTLAGLALGTAWLCVSVLVVEFALKREVPMKKN